jgi:predicted phosphodiesterase
MNIAIISDIHGNLEALERALSIIHSKPIDAIVCLGDIVGYGANPNECMALVRKEATNVLLGNHDLAAVDLSAAETFTPNARISAQWTYDQLKDEDKQFIKGLSYTLELNNLLFVHASPHEPEEWHYIVTGVDARGNFDHFREPICFIGHTHEARIFGKNQTQSQYGTMIKGEQYIINVGSIGQPRDGDWHLSFGIFDTEEWSYENIRSEYDVYTASEKIRKAGLPRVLAERILVGR